MRHHPIYYKFTRNALNKVLEQINLIKQGEQPQSKWFKQSWGICTNVWAIARESRMHLNAEYSSSKDKFLIESQDIVLEGIELAISSEYAHLFSGDAEYPICDPTGEKTSEELYANSRNKYTPDVIDARIKLTELIMAHCEENIKKFEVEL